MLPLTVEEIVKIEITRSSPMQNWEDVLASVKAAPKDRVIRFNNSLFIFTNRGDSIASFAMCNADELGDMLNSLNAFCTFMKSQGFKKLLFSTHRKAMLRIGRKGDYKFTFRESNKQFFGEIYLDV